MTYEGTHLPKFVFAGVDGAQAMELDGEYALPSAQR